MCGIAALIQGAPPFNFSQWALWGGTGRRTCQCCSDVKRKKAEITEVASIMEPLSHRGPDFQNTILLNLQSDVTVTLLAAVLWMRGENMTEQPASDGNNMLLFNGEIYDGLETFKASDGWEQSDTEQLIQALSAVSSDESLILRFLDNTRGPWSVIYWHSHTQRLYFGRDVLGRRSLQLLASPRGTTVISSVLPGSACCAVKDISPAGLFYLDLGGDKPSWGLVERTCSILRSLSNSNETENRLKTTAKVVRNTRELESISYLPVNWLRGQYLQQENLKATTCSTHEEPSMETCVELFLNTFRKSMKRRVKLTQRKNTNQVGFEPRFAVLFSGGIDSLFVVAMLDKILVPEKGIDLINVAFGLMEDLPLGADRMSAESAFVELCQMVSKSSKRNIRMIYVDVSPSEADRGLKEHVRALLQPCDQLMDESIGTALWFAGNASGECACISSDGTVIRLSKVTSETTILFSGLGADELMGGYKGRHRTIFRRNGVKGVLREMDIDLSRLWYRNLGRDDRVISDSGRELRHPFLDEDLISLVTSLPQQFVCDLSLPDGVGDKLLLRRAASALGLSVDSCSRPKRAIQFGSRSKHVLERKRA